MRGETKGKQEGGRVYTEYDTYVSLETSKRLPSCGSEGYTRERKGRNYNNNDGEKTQNKETR